MVKHGLDIEIHNKHPLARPKDKLWGVCCEKSTSFLRPWPLTSWSSKPWKYDLYVQVLMICKSNWDCQLAIRFVEVLSGLNPQWVNRDILKASLMWSSLGVSLQSGKWNPNKMLDLFRIKVVRMKMTKWFLDDIMTWTCFLPHLVVVQGINLMVEAHAKFLCCQPG